MDGALATTELPGVFADWFARRGWRPRPHQLAMLEKARAGRAALLIAPTGGGKTLAGFLRTGDTGVARRARQRVKPPEILLTTPEQLALFCAWEGARRYFEDLACVIVDEVHSIWPSKRGDLLALDLARLQQFAPRLRRVGLSATVDDPAVIQRWLAPEAVTRTVRRRCAAPPAGTRRARRACP